MLEIPLGGLGIGKGDVALLSFDFIKKDLCLSNSPVHE